MTADDERYLPEQPRRSNVARVVALLALVATVVVLFVVVSSSLSGDDGGGDEEATKVERSDSGPETPEEYVVEDGDSISVIAEKYGISVERIERLNPDLDPNTLATGLVIKLQK